MTAQRKLLSVVIPVLNEADNVAAIHERLATVATKLDALDRDLEILFVDDGSTDATFETLRGLRKADPRIHMVKLARNFGAHAAALSGLVHCRGDHAAILAADLQDPPETLLEMLAAADKGHDVVWASRESRDDPFLSVVLSRLYARTMRRIAFPNFPEQGVNFALLSRRVIDVVASRRERNSSLYGQVLWVGFPQTTIPYKRPARHSGHSKWSLTRRIKLAIDSFVAFSYVPIRFISVMGLVSTVAGFAYAVIVLTLRIVRGWQVEGWSSLMVALLFTGGVQMLMLGVIGEYLWRTLDETRGRPLFIVAESEGFDPQATAKRSPVAAEGLSA